MPCFVQILCESLSSTFLSAPFSCRFPYFQYKVMISISCFSPFTFPNNSFAISWRPFACVSVTFNSKTMFKYEERKDALIDYDNKWAKEVSKNRLSVKLFFSKFIRQWSEPRRTVPLYGMNASTERLFPVPLFYQACHTRFYTSF